MSIAPAPAIPTAPAPVPAPPFGRAHFRWIICGLLFLVTANNHVDRQVFGLLAPQLIPVFGWSATDYTGIVLWFQIGYAIGYLAAGRLFDRLGTRLGFALAVTAWSLAALLHAAATSVLGFKLVRLLLGLSQPSHMPGGIKVVAEWFPRSERALATGIFKTGSNLGAVLLPLLVPWMFFTLGWQATILITASTGFVWLVFWLWLYRPPAESARVSAEELNFIVSATPEPPPRPVSWRALLSRRETWAYINFKFLTDAIWHWYMAMLPLFLSQRFGLGLAEFGLPLVVVYVIADAGSIGGGWLSWHWIRRGWDITRARKAAMLLCCALTLPVIAVPHLTQLWPVIVLIGVAHAAHQGLTSNLFTAVSDLYPREAVGSVVGFGGTAGQIGAAVMTVLSGVALARTGSLTVMFLAAGSAYLVAFLIFHLLVPRLTQLELTEAPR